MPYEKLLRRGRIIVFLFGVGMLAVGGYFLLVGWTAFNSGQISVTSKFSPTYIAFRDGEHAYSYHLHLVLWLGLGSFSAGFSALAFYRLFCAPKEKKDVMFLTAALVTQKSNSRARTWVKWAAYFLFAAMILSGLIQLSVGIGVL